MNAIRLLLAAALTAFAAFGQTTLPRPEFEVSSIRPSGQIAAGTEVHVGVHVDGAQVHINSLSIRDYIRVAYRVKDYQVSGPEFLAAERFDIDAKLPAGVNRDQVPEMLQTLLEDRFQLKIHRGSKEFAVYALGVAAGGAKLKESPPDLAADAEAAKAPVDVNVTGGRGGTSINFGYGSSFTFADNHIEAKKLTMASLVDTLARFLDRPVVDMTDLKGKYDLAFDITPDDYRAMLIRSAVNAGVSLPSEALRLLEGATDESLFSALRTFGLKLETRKAPLDVLIIDHVQKSPTEN